MGSGPPPRAQPSSSPSPAPVLVAGMLCPGPGTAGPTPVSLLPGSAYSVLQMTGSLPTLLPASDDPGLGTQRLRVQGGLGLDWAEGEDDMEIWGQICCTTGQQSPRDLGRGGGTGHPSPGPAVMGSPSQPLPSLLFPQGGLLKVSLLTSPTQKILSRLLWVAGPALCPCTHAAPTLLWASHQLCAQSP